MQHLGMAHPSFKVEALDGLRGLAVLIVIISHSSNQGMHIIPGLDFSGIGKSGVYLFFLLSSFLLTYPFIVKSTGAFGSEFLKEYFFRRVFRIYPLYFIYITASLLTTYASVVLLSMGTPKGIPLTLDFYGYLDQLFMLNGAGITWSIPVEFQYYFILPVIAYIFSIRLNGSLVLSLVLTVMIVLVGIYLFPPGWEEGARTRTLGHHLPIFVIGSFVALVSYKLSSVANCSVCYGWGIDIAGVAAVLVVIALIPSVANVLFPGVHKIWIQKQFTLFALLWSVVLFSAVHGRGVVASSLKSGWLKNIGMVSFSAYLLHPMFIALAKRLPVERTLAAWVILFGTMAASYVTYRLIELPMSRVRYRQGRIHFS